MSIRAKKYISVRNFQGDPKLSDIQFVEEDLPALKNGEVLIEALYLSVDPYIRVVQSWSPIGSLMVGSQTAK